VHQPQLPLWGRPDVPVGLPDTAAVALKGTNGPSVIVWRLGIGNFLAELKRNAF